MKDPEAFIKRFERLQALIEQDESLRIIEKDRSNRLNARRQNRRLIDED